MPKVKLEESRLVVVIATKGHGVGSFRKMGENSKLDFPSSPNSLYGEKYHFYYSWPDGVQCIRSCSFSGFEGVVLLAWGAGLVEVPQEIMERLRDGRLRPLHPAIMDKVPDGVITLEHPGIALEKNDLKKQEIKDLAKKNRGKEKTSKRKSKTEQFKDWI